MSNPEDPTILESANALIRSRTAVNRLLKFRDEYMFKVAEKYSLLSEDAAELPSATTVAQVILETDQLIADKPNAIRRLFEDTLATLHDVEHIFARASPADKAEFCYLNGKALNTIQPDACGLIGTGNEATDLAAEASQWLTRALKFNPQCTDAWCELGECCWRQGDPSEAANHFRQALKINPGHVEALCQLSMVLRQLPSVATNQSNPEKSHSLSKTSSTESAVSQSKQNSSANALSESLQLAHQAVRQKPTDGHAWSVLGNALLTAFFGSFGSVAAPPNVSNNRPPPTGVTAQSGPVEGDGPNPRNGQLTSSQLIMTRCVAAYAQAAKDRRVALEPNFHYNRGVAWHFQDSFTNALCSWLRAICLDPQWSAPRTCATRLIEFLSELNNFMDQIRRELPATEITRTDSVEPTSSDSRSSGCHKTTRVRRDSQLRIAEFITPLAPCLTLVASLGSGPSDQSEKMISSSTKSQALTRLLGPYAASGVSTRALLSGVPQTGRGKKGRGSGKRPPVYISPFQNTTNWQLTLFEDLQIGSNKDRVCVGRVLKELPSDTDLALNLLLVDAHGTPLAARLYNIGKGLGPVRKDILAVPHPFVEEREVPGTLMDAVLAAVKCADSASELRSIENQLDRSVEEISLRSNNAASGSKVIPDTTLSQSDSPKIVGNMCIRILRVPIPDVLVVNGHPVGFRWTAAPVLKNIFFTAI